MADYRRYQPRRSRATTGNWGRWLVGVAVIIGVIFVGRLTLGGKKTNRPTNNSNSGITLLTDNSNRPVSSTNTNTGSSAVSAAGASWRGFSTKQCPAAISSFSSKKRVVLTIGLSAANDQVPAVLEALKTAGVPADFLSTGSFATKNPIVVKSVADAGYAVYSQSYDGTNLTTLSDVDVVTAITKAESAIEAATGTSPQPVFRPPGGSYTAQTVKLLNQQGYCAILWTVDGYDWQDGMTVAQAKERVETALAKASGGSIVALHAGYDITAELVKELVHDLKSESIEMTTLAGLLNAKV